MKILYYNWEQFDNPKHIGGGVTVYLNNLITYLINNTDNEIYFLSGGFKYNPFKNYIYLKETKNIFDPKCKSYEIINSPITAPQYTNFYNIEKYLNDTKTVEIFDKFIQEHGPFDVIHINNFEGISINVLNLKEKYQNTKFIFSVHNYQSICPLVQYFQNHNKCICKDYNNGNECLNCLNVKIRNKTYLHGVREYIKEIIPWIEKNAITKLLFKAFTSILSKPFQKQYITTKNNYQNGKIYKKYREQNIKLLNKYSDAILAVSDRVREIMIANGIKPEIIKTSYIGTKIAENALNKSRTDITNPFTIAFLGYARTDKGFWFLINCLKNLPEDITKNIKVVLAAKGYKNAKEDLKHFHSYEFYNGYTHHNLEKILQNVNLGIVPVLWEDNLPQVAIEMVANGVPILCSSFGGASELCSSDIFKFIGADKRDFSNKLLNLVQNPNLLNEYWKEHTGLTTMKKHTEELYDIYNVEGIYAKEHN